MSKVKMGDVKMKKSAQEVRDKHREYLWPSVANYYQVQVKRDGEGWITEVIVDL